MYIIIDLRKKASLKETQFFLIKKSSFLEKKKYDLHHTYRHAKFVFLGRNNQSIMTSLLRCVTFILHTVITSIFDTPLTPLQRG